MSAQIPLRGKNDEIRAYAVVDDEDFERVNQHRWHLSTNGYAISKVYLGGGRAAERYHRLQMHRLVLGLEPGDPNQGDHINGDHLDNRRANLRIVTGAQNAQNRTRTSGVSQFRGVHHKGPRYKSKPWEAVVRHNGQRHYLGLFATEAEAGAAAAAKRAEILPFSVERGE